MILEIISMDVLNSRMRMTEERGLKIVDLNIVKLKNC